MSNPVFLIDANILITPYHQFYPFDLARPFWDQLRQQIENGSIAILDVVKDEILAGNKEDELSKWIEETKINRYIARKDQDILDQYAEVMQYTQECGYYNDTALSSWAQLSTADPWLIATAKVKEFILVTFETNAHILDTKNPTRKVRIPDVARHFNVEMRNLFDMMRELKIHL